MKQSKKPHKIPEIIADMIMVRAADGRTDVYEQMLDTIHTGFTDKEREVVDRFLIALCGATYSNIYDFGEGRRHIDDMSSMNRMHSMNIEQRKEYVKISGYLDLFLDEMKERFAKKIKQGRSGFDQEDELQVPVYAEILGRIHRMVNNEGDIGVGLANWSFIHWFRQNVL